MSGTAQFDPTAVRFGVATTTSVADGGDAAERTREQSELFCRVLSAEDGLGFRARVFDDYPALLDALRQGELDVAWLPPVVALRATNFGHALPIALPVRDGVCAYHAALFAKPDSPVRSVADLSGARVAWVDRFSASGYLVMRAALQAEGVELGSAFGVGSFAGSHEAAVEAVFAGDADVGASFLHLNPDGSVRKAGWGARAVQRVHTVGPIPGDVIAASVRVPVAEIRRVQRCLIEASPELSRSTQALMGAEGFAEAKAAHLAPLDSLLNFLEGTTFRQRSVLPPKP